MSITNNEVKFLVTLDIDEAKSKKKIDAFLTKVTKEQKLTFGVNVGQSNENIKKFLDKQQNKKVNLDFDVSVGQSKANIQTFLNNQKQAKKSLIFYVNEQATKATVNSALKKIEVNPLLINLSVNHKVSKANINKFLTETKVNNKAIELVLSKKASIDNINKGLKNATFNIVRIKLGLVSGAFDNIKETIGKKEFGGLSIVGQLDATKTKERIQEQINKMHLPKFKVDVVANVTPVVSSKTAQAIVKQKSTSTEEANTDKVYSGNKASVIKQIKEEYKQAGKVVEAFNTTVAKGEQDFINRLKKQGNQVDIVRDAQTKEITKITATYKNSANEIQKTFYTPLVAQYNTLNAKTGEATKEIRGFVAQTEKLKNTETFNLKQSIEDFNKKLIEAKHNSTILAKEYDKLSKSAKSATSNNDMDKLNNQLETHQSEMRKRNQLEKAQINLMNQREQLVANLTRVEKMYLRTVNKEESEKIKLLLKGNDLMKPINASPKELYKLNMGDITKATNEITKIRSQIKQLNADATEATKNSMGIINALKVAMEKFPIWMIASTAFYGTIGTLREFGSIILDIDKKMTDLKKVMATDTDFGKIFADATVQAETFGQTISSTLDAYAMFAKQGFKGEELNQLASAGLVAGNVGDIDTGKASEYLTASILQWNKETSEAMSIVDGWNEISNKYATTVENLAQGQAKAGATAKALGLDFDELNAVVGTLNARTKQSGNEIGNFIKSTFPNLLSDKGQSVLSGLGVALEDGEGNLRNIMDIYKDVAKEYKNLSQSEQNQVTLGLGGKYHISRLQTLLDDLGSVDSMYDQMLDSSRNSANSAMEENATYMQSLEARMNLARVEVEKLAIAIGDAVMTDTMVAGLQLFSTVLSGITGFVSKFGVLPATIGTVVVALALFSNRFSDMLGRVQKGENLLGKFVGWISSVGKETTATNVIIAENSDHTKQNTSETDKNTEAKKKSSKASKLMSLSFGAVGLASVGLGVALEVLIGWYGKAKQAKEELKAKSEQELKAYSDNETAITELTKKYTELSEEQKGLSLSGKELSSEKYQELLDVQNKLGDLLPQLKKGEDEYGNSILVSSQITETKIALLKEELEIQRKLNEEKIKEEQEESEKTAKKTIKTASNKEEDGLQISYNFTNQLNAFDKKYKELKNELGKESLLDGITMEEGKFLNTLNSIDDVALAVERVNFALSKKDELDYSDDEAKQLEFMKSGLENQYKLLLQAQSDILSGLGVLKTGVEAELDETVKTFGDFSKEGQEVFEDVAISVINLTETQGDLESFDEVISDVLKQKNSGLETEFDALAEKITEMKNSGITDAKELEAQFGESMEKIKTSILQTLVNSGLEEGSANYVLMKTILDNLTTSTLGYESSVREVMNAHNLGREEAIAYLEKIDDGASTMDEATDSMEAYVNSIKSFDSLGEQLLGVTDKQITETKDLISVYTNLSNKTELTANEQKVLEESMKRLKALYPHLVKNGELRIDNVIAENKMNEILRKSYENMADEKYNSEEEATYNSALGTKARIDNIKQELLSLETMMEKYRELDVDTNDKIMRKVQSGELDMQTALPMMKEISEYNSKVSELDGYMNSLNSSINDLSSSNHKYSEETNSSSDSTKKATKEQTALEKITAKYALTLNKLNTALKEVQARQKKYPTYSKQYRQALLDENKLIEKQIELNNQKAKDLATVKNVEEADTSGSYTTFSSVTPSGWSGQITSNFGKRSLGNHTGIDIDGAIGDLLQSNVKGKVTRKGSDSKSGNYVYVMDDTGLQHFYAHLDSISVAVGDIVDVGTKLGTIGNTGNVVSGSGGDGSHLHYGVKKGDTWIDPTSYAQSARSGVQTSSQTKASSGSSTQNAVWNFFKNKGLSDVAVSAIMGNMQQESGFNSSAVNKSSGASGLAQWLGSRKTGLNSYASSKGTEWTDVQTQLEYMWKELNGSESKSLKVLQQQGLSVSDMTKLFENAFERSGNSAIAKRQGYANNIYNQYAGTSGSGTSTASSTTSSSSGDQRSDALAQIESLKQENIALAEQAQENYYKGITSTIESYKRDVSIEDIGIAKQEEMQKNMLETSKEYVNSVNKQYTAEQRKLKSYQAEYAYIQKMYDAGGLTLSQQDELIDRRYELQQQMLESQNQSKEYYNEIISGRLAGFDKKMDSYSKTLEWEEVKIQALDKTSDRYTKTLQIMANARKGQLTTAKAELEYVNKMLGKGNLTIELYEDLTQRADELKKELVEVNQALHQVNYEMVQAVAIASDLKIDDIDFEISYSQAYRETLEEGSGEYKEGLEYELERLKEKLEEVKNKGLEIQESMKGKDLGQEELQNLEEQLEDNALAYLDVKNAIKDTQDAIKEFSKTIEDEIKEKREDLADELIDALKDAIEEAKDIQLDAIDKLIEAEEERHEKVIKQYDDELEAYTKIIDAKRREIDDADRDRSHGNKLDELNTEKQDLQSRLNLLANVNTYEGIKEKEELQKKIAEIEKQITEEKYQYEKDLREQQLDDLLDEKTENIEDLKEKEDKYSEDVLKSLNKQKEYWEKYYEDLLNDETEFNRIKKLMAEGHYEEVEALYGEYIDKLKASLPDLEDTFDGTWTAVGTQIRENVISEMENLLDKIKEVEAEIKKMNDLKNSVTGDYGSNISDVNQTLEDTNKGTKLSEADMKVIMAKFMSEQIAGSLDPVKDATRIQSIKAKADKLASEGRGEGSTISASQSLGSLFDSFSTNQLGQVGNYFTKNASESGFSNQEYLDYIEKFGQTAQVGKTLTHGDKQVMLAKYIKESILPQTSDVAKRNALTATSNKIAESGRKNTSLISAGVSYDQSLKQLSGKQQAELGTYMLQNANVISYPELRSILTKYADTLRLNSSNDYVGMDVGGMTKGFGSSGGVDGKGGKFALLHQNEIVSNPLDTERMLRISSIMDNVMRTINGAISLPTLPKIQNTSTPTSTDNSTVIHINIDNMNGTQSDVDSLAKQIQNRLLREKGKR